ncbi:hypothetical protein THAOC_35613 [Thalassiosira oceanica]|uniref:Uncharacterized protein n=1 Tax=Thalassiosira oceanica TaxID=159749 RepID=K0R0M9_THAOC|nr:hypothetical protein THAOC_35613 [Thalassiosira oceanica]|eukprot:EJK45758.1 hypothetical protein THAOC_35613 [Thalassiosira oceanica]
MRTGARQSGPGLSLPSTAAASARLPRPSRLRLPLCPSVRCSVYLAPRIRRLVSVRRRTGGVTRHYVGWTWSPSEYVLGTVPDPPLPVCQRATKWMVSTFN